MKRWTPRELVDGVCAARSAQRKPEWDAYLTDDSRYRLAQQRELQRSLQQLSAAHGA